MADYGRGGQTFRSVTKSGVEFPVIAAAAHTRTYTGVQSLTLSASSQALTVPANTEFADIYFEGGSSSDYARFWHGSTPTASAGVKLKDDGLLQSADPSSFRAILGSGSGTLRVEYYRYI